MMPSQIKQKWSCQHSFLFCTYQVLAQLTRCSRLVNRTPSPQGLSQSPQASSLRITRRGKVLIQSFNSTFTQGLPVILCPSASAELINNTKWFTCKCFQLSGLYLPGITHPLNNNCVCSQTWALTVQRSIPGDKRFQATTISAMLVCTNTHSRVLYSSSVAQKPHKRFGLLNSYFGVRTDWLFTFLASIKLKLALFLTDGKEGFF